MKKSSDFIFVLTRCGHCSAAERLNHSVVVSERISTVSVEPSQSSEVGIRYGNSVLEHIPLHTLSAWWCGERARVVVVVSVGGEEVAQSEVCDSDVIVRFF